jgi:hypothetical protein
LESYPEWISFFFSDVNHVFRDFCLEFLGSGTQTCAIILGLSTTLALIFIVLSIFGCYCLNRRQRPGQQKHQQRELYRRQDGGDSYDEYITYDTQHVYEL